MPEPVARELVADEWDKFSRPDWRPFTRRILLLSRHVLPARCLSAVRCFPAFRIQWRPIEGWAGGPRIVFPVNNEKKGTPGMRTQLKGAKDFSLALMLVGMLTS